MWPDDGKPRFKATEPYSLSVNNGDARPNDYTGSAWFQAEILGSAYCHEIVETVVASSRRECDELLRQRTAAIEAEMRDA